MFNPFYPFTLPLLEALVDRGKVFFVRQDYPRGRPPFAPDHKVSLLITPYTDLTTAEDHFGAIGHDPLRFLYRWEEHAERLRAAATPREGYTVYAPLCRPSWERGITDEMRAGIRRYVAKLGWAPGGGSLVDTAYEVRFGELYIRLRFKKREVKLKFEEIENLR